MGQVANLPYTLILLESPHRIVEALEDLLASLGDRRICVAREMTKMFEEMGAFNQRLIDAAGRDDMVVLDERGIEFAADVVAVLAAQHVEALRGVIAAGHQPLLGQVHRFERRWERWRPVPKDRWRENASPQDGGGILLLPLHPLPSKAGTC